MTPQILQFFYKSTKQPVENDIAELLFIDMYGNVFQSNQKSYESQSSTVDLDNFLDCREDIIATVPMVNTLQYGTGVLEHPNVVYMPIEFRE